MNDILSIDNSDDWSWGIVVQDLLSRLRGYTIKRFSRIPNTPIDRKLVDESRVILMQNVDHMKLVENKDLNKSVVRIGGMYVDSKNPMGRFDKELSDCGAVISTNGFLHGIAKSSNGNSYLIPNGLDLNVFRPIPGKTVGNPFRVGFSGNITGVGLKYKGFKVFAEAVTRMYGEVESVKLFYGDNQIPYEDMPTEFYGKVDCVISLSVAEGCSNTVKEALACGVPVITTKVGYHGEKLKHMHNCIFVERNATQVVNAIRALRGDSDLRNRLARNGRLFSEEHHDIDIVVGMYKHVIDTVLNRSNDNG